MYNVLFGENVKLKKPFTVSFMNFSCLESDSLCFVWQGKREEMFMKHPKLRKFFNLVLRNEAQLEKCDKEKAQFERNFLSHLFVQYLSILSSVPEEGMCLLFDEYLSINLDSRDPVAHINVVLCMVFNVFSQHISFIMKLLSLWQYFTNILLS